MNASILALATAVPTYAFSQEKIAASFLEMLSPEPETALQIEKLHQNSTIQTRHSVIADFDQARSNWKFWGPEFPKKVPGMSERNDLYKHEAPKLALEVAEKAIKQWGQKAQELTHIVVVSCTGLIAPGIECLLMQRLNLNPNVQRLGINFMGCFGAFKGLSVAKSYARENPKNRVLVVCIEFCSLHFQIEQTVDNLLANSLFSDGAAAVIVGINPHDKEVALCEITHQTSYVLKNTLQEMQWEACNTGFTMKLSHKVAVLLGRNIEAFVRTLIDPLTLYQTYNWAIHPGGKSIIQAIEKALNLSKESTAASWEVLANYGNMSSATFLFVLEKVLKQEERKEQTVGLAFGPGLSIEGIVLKEVKKAKNEAAFI